MAKAIFYDSLTGHYFSCEEEKIRESIERLNKEILDRSSLDLYDIYEEINKNLPENMKIGLKPVSSELCLDYDYHGFDKNSNYKPICLNHDALMPIIKIKFDDLNIRYKKQEDL